MNNIYFGAEKPTLSFILLLFNRFVNTFFKTIDQLENLLYNGSRQIKQERV